MPVFFAHALMFAFDYKRNISMTAFKHQKQQRAKDERVDSYEEGFIISGWFLTCV